MKTPLPSDDRTLPALLASGWGVEVAVKPQFLPLGDSAYSYRVEAVTDEHYYLKVVDRSTVRGRQTAERMRICHYILERDVATVIRWRSFTPDGTHGGQVFIGDRASFVKGHTQCFVLRFGPTDANPHD